MLVELSQGSLQALREALRRLLAHGGRVGFGPNLFESGGASLGEPLGASLLERPAALALGQSQRVALRRRQNFAGLRLGAFDNRPPLLFQVGKGERRGACHCFLANYASHALTGHCCGKGVRPVTYSDSGETQAPHRLHNQVPVAALAGHDHFAGVLQAANDVHDLLLSLLDVRDAHRPHELHFFLDDLRGAL